MKLMTKAIENKLSKYPIYSQDGKGLKAHMVVKYFNSWGAGTWLVTEGEKLADGDWELFGYIHIHEWEWGYVRLSELESLRGVIERDLYASGTVEENL